MLLEKYLPNLPITTTEALVYIVAIIGALLLAYSVFLEQERRQDLVKLIGASCLLVYALFISNIIFIIAMGGLAIASLIEIVEIYMGLHKHDKQDLKKYKKIK